MDEKLCQFFIYSRPRAISTLFCVHQDTEREWWEIISSLSKTIFTQKNYQRIYATRISKLCNIGSKFVVILHISWNRAVSLIFCSHQDTESWKQEKEISIARPIFTKKQSPKVICEKDIHHLQHRWELPGNYPVFNLVMVI